MTSCDQILYTGLAVILFTTVSIVVTQMISNALEIEWPEFLIPVATALIVVCLGMFELPKHVEIVQCSKHTTVACLK